MSQDIKLLKSFENDFKDQAYKILQENLGESYLTFDDFKHYVNDDKCLIFLEREEVVGVLIFYVQSEIVFFKSMGLDGSYTNENVLVLKTLAVKYKKKGYGTILIDYCLKNYQKNISKVYSPVWQSKLGTNAKKLMESFGLHEVLKFENFWYNDSLGKQNYCPVCNTPCNCTLVIYSKNTEK